MAAREIIMHLRLNEREHARLQQYARQEQIGLSEAMRLLIRNAPIEEGPADVAR